MNIADHLDIEVKIPGTLVDNTNTRDSLRQKFLKEHYPEWKQFDRFPGAQVVSLAQQNIALLQQQDYMVCEKTDGVRVFLWFFSNTTGNKLNTFCFFVDRNFDFFQIPNWFPKARLNPKNRQRSLYSNVLLDGELVHDTINDKKHLVFYVFDAMHVDKPLRERNLRKRLAYVQQVVFLHHDWMKNCPGDNTMTKEFVLKAKPFAEVTKSEVRRVFDSLNKLAHETDGLIFTPVDVPYASGTMESLLKWKPKELNTVDFALSFDHMGDIKVPVLTVTGREGIRMNFDVINLSVRKVEEYYRRAHEAGTEIPILECRPTERVGRVPLPLNQQSITRLKPNEPALDQLKCSEREGQFEWECLRMRTDRKEPNFIGTVQKVLASIKDGITIDVLVEFIKDADEKQSHIANVEYLPTPKPAVHPWMIEIPATMFPLAPKALLKKRSASDIKAPRT
ncbi:hypothetical protein PCE1_003978 [Barthelona sp. PCE]